ncbi:chorismate synthase [Candidatus Peregrinibacteria bacterium CG11_big_fil_rev_8_21_14_0_20_46_8]|nr:MAG: chorismate synthase [Candidatus Peregrinibacteria bacterium CG11_big_fil_rev_8_21_14_0_20_46_8]
MNTIGTLFRVTTFGESHGGALGCVIDGCPSKIKIDESIIQRELDRRKPGQSKITTPRKEADQVRILSGVFEGKTLGSPIAMLVENTNQRSKDYSKLKNVFRPGHADYTWEEKFGFRDYRGGGRSSGRETVGRVMAGAVAKQLLARQKIQIFAYAVQVGPVRGEKVDLRAIEKNLVRAADPQKAKEMEAAVLEAQKMGDSLGGIVEILIKNVPVGLGEPVFGKINSDLAQALMSIPTTKAFEIGSGFAAAQKYGSEQNDPFTVNKGEIRMTKNDAGGISGGITNGEDIVMRVHVKPPSSILKKQQTVTKTKKETDIQVTGRHDPCIIPRFIPVAESMAAIVVADHILRYRAIRAF